MYLIILSTKFTAQISRYLDVWSYNKKKRKKDTERKKGQTKWWNKEGSYQSVFGISTIYLLNQRKPNFWLKHAR